MKNTTLQEINFVLQKTNLDPLQDHFSFRFLKVFLILFFIFFSSLGFGQGTTCATATSITVNGSCLSGTISNTSQDLPNISGCSGTFNREGWFTFTVSGGATNIVITATTTNRNLYLQLISSTSTCTGLVQIACANNINSEVAQTESIVTNLDNGIYYIKVVNVGSNSNMTLSSLCVSSSLSVILPAGTSFVVPSGVCAMDVECWGAGGGGARVTGNPNSGGGGSGGGYVKTSFENIGGNTYTYQIGVGGSGGTGTKTGTSTWFGNTSTLLAVGGNGATNLSSGFGSGATAPSTGNVGGTLNNSYGGNGAAAVNAANDTSGGGGSSGGSTASGNGIGTSGGVAPTNGYSGGNGSSGSTGGAVGSLGNIGAGGGGGRANSGTDRLGGNGGSGQIRVTYKANASAGVTTLSYGSDVWNVYAWNGGDASGGSGAWNTDYRGYYVDNNLNFNAITYWGSSVSPSSATGWSGCSVDIDNSSFAAKRQGFPCGLYQIDVVRNDDAAQLYVNDVLVWSRTDWSGSGATPAYNLNVWQGTLGSTDRVEFRVSDGTGDWYGNITFTTITATAPNLVASSNVVCTGSSTTLTASGTNIGSNTSTLWFETATCPTMGFVQEFQTFPYTTSQTTLNSLTSGIATVTSDNVMPADPNISMETILISAINPAVQRYISIRYRIVSGTGLQSEIYFKKASQSLAEDKVVRGNLISDGDWHVLSIDMGSNVNWNNTGGNITGWRFDYTTGGNVEMEIDYIVLSSNPVLENTATDDSSITVSPTVSPTTYNVLRIAESVCGTVSACATTQIYINKTWSGGPTGNWNVAGNWTPSGVPTVGECVVSSYGHVAIPANANANSITLTGTASLTVNSNYTLTVNNAINTSGTSGTFTVQNNGSLVQNSEAANTGSIIVLRNAHPMKRYDFTYWSSPVNPQTLYNLSSATLFNKYCSWNPSSGWTIHNNGAAIMEIGKGYIVRAPQSFPINSTNNFTGTFIGNPNNGEKTVPGFQGSSSAEVWNLIGNPYPSAIDIDLFLADPDNTEVGGTIYLWTHNTPPADGGSGTYTYTAHDYASYNLSGGVATAATEVLAPDDPTEADDNDNAPVNGHIASGQSFFIRGIVDGAGTVKFKNSMRIAGNNANFFKPGPTTPVENWEMTGKHRFWLNLTNAQGAFNQTMIGYVQNATDDLDRLYDGQLFGGNFVTIYSLLDQNKLTIQGKALPFNDEDVVPLGYKTTIAGTFSISLDHFDGLFEGQDVFLRDNLLNTIQNLKEGDYSFASAIGTFDNRFEIVYQNETLGTENPQMDPNSILVYKNTNADIAVNAGLLSLEEIKVYDIAGRLLYQSKGINNTEALIQNLPETQQVLVVDIRTTNGFKVAKKIVF